MLSQEVSAESGLWQTSKAEYQREMMDVITESQIVEVTVMKSVRSGGTQSVIDNAIAYFIHQDPGPMLVVHPGKEEARIWSKDHFDTMVRDTKVLHGLVFSDKIKDKKNEILHKIFPGGVLYIIGSNSASGFSQKTIQRVFLDDIDRYEPSASNEGDQIKLARNRTITYMHHSRKIIKVSNPTTRGVSRIEQEYLLSDQRHYYMPCPFCGHKQVLIFSPQSQFANLARSHLKFDDKNNSWRYYECENCHKQIDEKYKLKMIQNGEWRKSNPNIIDHAGFHINELMSPFSSWEDIVKDFLESKRNREQLRVFINQRLGETFIEEKSIEVDNDSLISRREDYSDIIPNGVLVITLAIDRQRDRLESVLLGWGKGYECWFLDHRIFYFVKTKYGNDVWKELDDYISRGLKHESGLILKPFTTNGLACVCIDSGDSPDDVYQYVKARQSRRFFAVKGDDGFDKQIIHKVTYNNRYGARLIIVGVDTAKQKIYDRLNITDVGPYYFHFNKSCNDEFFKQLTSEKIVWKQTPRGYPKKVFELKSGMRNEILDCYTYNLAAITLLNPNWDILKENLESKIQSMNNLEKEQSEENKVIKNKNNKIKKPRKNWATNF